MINEKYCISWTCWLWMCHVQNSYKILRISTKLLAIMRIFVKFCYSIYSNNFVSGLCVLLLLLLLLSTLPVRHWRAFTKGCGGLIDDYLWCNIIFTHSLQVLQSLRHNFAVGRVMTTKSHHWSSLIEHWSLVRHSSLFYSKWCPPRDLIKWLPYQRIRSVYSRRC